MTTPQEQARPVPPSEQRTNHRLRERFDTAVALLKPLFAKTDQPQGAVFFRALSRLHDQFPDMSQAELEALVVSVTRALSSR